MPISFNDLVPQTAAKPAGLSFDDLVPKAGPAATSSLAEATPAAPTYVYRGTLLPFEKMSDGRRRLAVPGIISDAIDAVRLPEKVAAGKVDPMSDDGFRQALGLAGLVTGGNFPKSGAALVNSAGKIVPDAVASALRADGVPLGDVASRVGELGPAGVVADIGPNSRFKAAALATRPGAAQTAVVDTMRARQRSAPQRLTGALDDTLGPAPVPSYVDRSIQENMRAMSPDYDAALVGAAPVDTSAVAAAWTRTSARCAVKRRPGSDPFAACSTRCPIRMAPRRPRRSSIRTRRRSTRHAGRSTGC